MTTLTRCVTYDTVTPESAEHGDVAACGFSTEPETVTLREAVEDIRRAGVAYVEATYNGLRVSHLDELDYRTGEVTTETTHLTCPPSTARRVARLISARR
jgi:hypothetical protein